MSKDVRRRLVLLALVAAASAVPATALGLGSRDKPRSVVGTLEIGHSDNFRTGRAKHFSSLRTDNGSIALRFRGAPPDRLSGSRVRVTGVRERGALTVRSIRVLRRPGTTMRALSAAGSPVTVRVAVILFNFTDDRSEPWSPDAARGVVFANEDSVAVYYREVSYGSVSVVGDVFGWLTIPSTSSACAPGAWADAAKNAVAGTGVSLSGYDKFVLMFPRAASCAWNGLGASTDAWINGELSRQVATHEVGHTLGLVHSKSMSCTAAGVRVAIATDTSTCATSEYGDPFDVMGSGTGRHVNNVAKAGRSWLDAAGTRQVTASGDYDLSFVETPSPTGPQLLRVQRADGSWLNLEYRRPYGRFDNFVATDPVVNGVSIRWSPISAATPYLLDATPATPSFGDAPLAPGRTFEDLASGITITTTALSSDAATVRVALPGGTPADGQPPSAPGTLSAVAESPTTINLAWSAATDNVGVASYRISRDGAVVATVSPSSRFFADGGRSGGATYGYTVVAIDAAGNAGPPASASATTPTPPPAADTTAPTAPSALAVQLGKGKKVALTWTPSSDDVGVSGYRVFRNGALVGTVPSTSFADALTGKGGATYTVVAFDAAGNVSPASNAVRIG
jgi:hypothetical protein